MFVLSTHSSTFMEGETQVHGSGDRSCCQQYGLQSWVLREYLFSMFIEELSTMKEEMVPT